jgi:hypothetical protein
MQDKGVHEGIDYKIILAVGRAQKMPAVVQVGYYPSILVRMVWMIMATDILDDRIDLDGIDLAPNRNA